MLFMQLNIKLKRYLFRTHWPTLHFLFYLRYLHCISWSVKSYKDQKHKLISTL